MRRRSRCLATMSEGKELRKASLSTCVLRCTANRSASSSFAARPVGPAIAKKKAATTWRKTGAKDNTERKNFGGKLTAKSSFAANWRHSYKLRLPWRRLRPHSQTKRLSKPTLRRCSFACISSLYLTLSTQSKLEPRRNLHFGEVALQALAAPSHRPPQL